MFDLLGTCLNGGKCTESPTSEKICECKAGFSGEKYDLRKVVLKIFQ